MLMTYYYYYYYSMSDANQKDLMQTEGWSKVKYEATQNMNWSELNGWLSSSIYIIIVLVYIVCILRNSNGQYDI